jgi:site-specific DNA-adenine methylase
VRPLFPYYGSKWNIARHYPRPVGDVVEPFAGGAGYATFYDAPRAHLVDADPIIVGVWSYLLRVKPAEIEALPLLPEVGDNVDNYNLPQEAKWLIGFWLNRGSAQPKKSRTAYSARTDKAQLNWGQRAKDRIISQLELISGWTVRQGDFTSAPNIAGTWFIDPPYGDKGKFYRVPFSDFARLAPWCHDRRGQLIVCEGPGADWLPFQPLGNFKSSKGKAMEYVFARAA